MKKEADTFGARNCISRKATHLMRQDKVQYTKDQFALSVTFVHRRNFSNFLLSQNWCFSKMFCINECVQTSPNGRLSLSVLFIFNFLCKRISNQIWIDTMQFTVRSRLGHLKVKKTLLTTKNFRNNCEIIILNSALLYISPCKFSRNYFKTRKFKSSNSITSL